MIKEARWSGWVWVGECFFWYRPTRVVPDQRPLNGRCCCCCRSNGCKDMATSLGSLTRCLAQRLWSYDLMALYKSVYYYLFDAGTQFPGNEKKITLCNTKSSVLLLLLLLLLWSETKSLLLRYRLQLQRYCQLPPLPLSCCSVFFSYYSFKER